MQKMYSSNVPVVSVLKKRKSSNTPTNVEGK